MKGNKMTVNSDGTVTLTVKELEYAIRNGIAQNQIQDLESGVQTNLKKSLSKR